MGEISELEWLILDSLADATECMTIVWSYVRDELPGISESDLKNAIHQLYERGYVNIPDKTTPVTREDILAEETDNEYSIGNYYFGLTQAGAELWEETLKEYGEPIDWSDSWIGSYNYERQEGYIDGTSREVCFKRLSDWNEKEKEWQIDMNSLIDSEIEGFHAKYYKYLEGGHRISFKLKER